MDSINLDDFYGDPSEFDECTAKAERDESMGIESIEYRQEIEDMKATIERNIIAGEDPNKDIPTYFRINLNDPLSYSDEYQKELNDFYLETIQMKTSK